MEGAPSAGDTNKRQSRLYSFRHSVRSALQDLGTPSSVYSRTTNAVPAPRLPFTTQDAAKITPTRPLFGLMPQSADRLFIPPPGTAFHRPFNHQGSHTNYSPVSPPSEWDRNRIDQLSPAALSPQRTNDMVYMPDEEAALPTKKRRRRKHRQQGAWTRKRKTQSGSRTCAALFHGPSRMKFIICILSGLLLASLLTIYLSVATTVRRLAKEAHIVFIVTILAATVFFAHSLVRLIVATIRLHKSTHPRRRRPRIPPVAGPGDFKPDVPIPVQLARDEETAAQDDDGTISDEKFEILKQPPPAYGLWRCSVRLDPDLLHWQRAQNVARPARPEAVNATPVPAARGSPTSLCAPPTEESTRETGRMTSPVDLVGARRPPSYISEDGVSYVVSALPPRPPSEIHPALRIRLP